MDVESLRRLHRPLLAGALLLLPGLLLAGCASVTRDSAYGPYPAPPPIPGEVVPKPPVSEDPLIWQPGHWDWSGSDYLWREGRWVVRAGHGTQWQDGYWSSDAGKWRWVPAHWI
jgi:hypothetical protein